MGLSGALGLRRTLPSSNVAQISRSFPRNEEPSGRRARYKVASKERKRETRRNILAGAWVRKEEADDPEASARLLQGLEGFLTRPHDRKLFDLEPLPEDDE